MAVNTDSAGSIFTYSPIGRHTAGIRYRTAGFSMGGSIVSVDLSWPTTSAPAADSSV